jgi:hypothetical protein
VHVRVGLRHADCAETREARPGSGAIRRATSGPTGAASGNSRPSCLTHDSNLRWRARDDLRAALVAAYRAADADALAAVTHLWPPEGAAVLDPDHDREASGVRVVHADVEERRRACAGRGKACASYPASNRCDAPDGAPGFLPGDGTTARDGAPRGRNRTLRRGAGAPSRYRSDDQRNNGDLPQDDPFRLIGHRFSSECGGSSRGRKQVGPSTTRTGRTARSVARWELAPPTTEEAEREAHTGFEPVPPP